MAFLPPEQPAGEVDLPWAPDAVAEVAAQDPDRPATVCGEDILTFGQLHERANRLAAALRSCTRPGDRVLVRHDRLADLAVSCLAVTDAGLVSVLVDPSEPVERVRALAEAVTPVGLLTELAPLEGLELDTVTAIDGPCGAASGPRPRPPADAPASIAFTSGSTGAPKGIVLPVAERGAVARILGLVGITDGAGRHLGVPFVGSSPGSDGPLHAAFALGSTVHGFDVRHQGLHEIGGWLVEHRIDVFSAVPTAYRFLLSLLADDQVLPDLQILVSFGEPLDGDLVAGLRRHLSPEARLLNIFGLTESRTVASLVIEPDDVPPPGPLPAGRALPGIEIEVVDEAGQAVPAGQVGEIWITSRTAGLGYWADPEGSAAVFHHLGDGRRRVRTGDAGRLTPDGVLEHLGRLDHVVKVAGNRVDLAEVEDALRRLDGVVHAAVVGVEDRHGDLRLRAAVVGDAAGDLDPAQVTRDLGRAVSRWSVPDVIEVWDTLPTLATGKVDRTAVAAALAPSPDRGGQAAPPEPTTPPEPTDDLLERLLGLWREELEVPDLGPDEDFFAAGGDSLRGARLFLRIEEELGLDRPLSLLVSHPTARSLAAVLPLDRGVWDVLVPIRIAGDGVPLVVVHGGHGEVLFARDLAQMLPEDHPVYGLRAEALDGHPPRATTLEEIAAGYVAHLRRVRPHGPYAFYGHSLGGLLALEMALRLEDEGEEVVLLALGDTRAPGVSPHTASRVERLGRHLRAVREQGPAPAVALLGRQLANLRRRWAGDDRRQAQDRARWDAIAGPHPVAPQWRGDHVMFHYGLLAEAYRPDRRYRHAALLLRAELSIAHRGWDRHVEQLEVVDVPGSHGQLNRQPGLASVAAAIGAALARVWADGRPPAQR